MKRFLFTTLMLFTLGIASAAEKPDVAKPVELALEDQFEKNHTVADFKGKVLILVYGDQKGTQSCRELGTKLHVLFHPTAEGQTPAKAKQAPVVGLPGLAPGKVSPEVEVVPVACAGKVPGPVKTLLRATLKKDAPETPVLLDFGSTMTDLFGLRAGEPNIAVIDAQGRLRLKVNGMPDKATFDKVLQVTQNLRAEAAGLK
jgi:hypothetical protein